MRNPFNLNTKTKKPALAAAFILIGLLVFFLKWIPFWGALALTVTIPFLYFIPGYFLTKMMFPDKDILQTSILSLLLSVFTINLGIFAVEEATKQMGLLHIFVIAFIINALSPAAFLALRRSLPARLLARLRGKFHKRDQKQS